MFDFSFPWNQKTLYGWIIETILNSTGFTSYIFYCFSFLSFFIGIVEYQRAFFTQFKILYDRLNSCSGQNYVEAESHLIRTIRFHVMMIKYGNLNFLWKLNYSTFLSYRYYEQTANTFGIFVLSKLIAFGLEAACSIFQLDMVSDKFIAINSIYYKFKKYITQVSSIEK